MQKEDEAKDFLPDEQNADKVSDYPAVLVIYSAIATAALVFLLWVFPNPFVMLLPFFVPKLILAILKKESPPGQQDKKVVRTLLLLSVFISTVVSVLFCAGTTDAAFGMRYAFLSFNTVLGISVFFRFSMPRYWSLSVVVLYLIQLGWALERFFANPGM